MLIEEYMKKNLFYLFMLMAVVVMPLTSCEKDSQKEGELDPKSDADKVEITGYDALSWLQGSLVVVDKNNEVIRRVYGKPLDKSQPEVISVPVADYGAAEKLFLSWVAPKKVATAVEGGYDFALTDIDGESQGSVSFRAEDGEAGVLARMSVAEGTDLKQVSEVRFIDHDFWPENDVTPEYLAGKTYVMDGYYFYWDYVALARGGYYKFKDNKLELEPLVFYCIQSNTDGKEGILVWLCPDDGDDYRHPGLTAFVDTEAYRYLPTEIEAKKVLDFYNSNYEFWENMIDEMEDKGYVWDWHFGFNTTGNEEFVFNSYDPETKLIKFLDFDDKVGEIGAAEVGNEIHHYRYMHIRIVPPVNY